MIKRKNKSLDEIKPEDSLKESNDSPKEETEQPSVFSEVALGMYKIVEGAGTKYVLVEIPYDPKTGVAGKAKELAKDIREDIIDKFKAEASNFFRSE